MVNKQVKYSLFLLIPSIIWGFAFAFQKFGANAIGPYTFIAFRNYFAAATMLLLWLGLRKKSKEENYDIKYTIKIGIILGLLELSATTLQQIGIGYTTASKSSFITSTYVILVPIIGYFGGKKLNKRILLCVILELLGLYLLCIKEDFSINFGDVLTMTCALIFAFHIVTIDKASKSVDIILLNLVQFITCSIFATFTLIGFEFPLDIQGVKQAIVPLAYTGILSSAICVTIQVLIQKELDPTIASLIMCIESVFGAIGGWLILNEILNTKELLGCAIVFASIVISQLPEKKKRVLKNFS